MTPERWQQAREIFKSALEREASEQAAFLDEACSGDESLRLEVESLLTSLEEGGSFLETPAYRIAADQTNMMTEEQGATVVVGQTINHYRVTSPLGSGGMGEVYLAEDTRLGRRVALKFLPTLFTQDKRHLHRFEQEARAVAALSHPNVCTIHEVVETGEGRHCIVMEYVEGVTLRERIAERRMNVSEALDAAVQVTSALSAAHAAGIVHRDIKPENIMLRRDGYVKVLDFGLAKLTEKESGPLHSEGETRALELKTSPGMVMGTVAYMSPEQARALPIDARTDVWSLGVVLYEMVAGQQPFDGATATDVIISIAGVAPESLGRWAPEVPIQLEQIVKKALAKDREERYQTAEDLLIDLRNLKRKLEVDAEIERTVPPELRGVRSTKSTSTGYSTLATGSGSVSATTPTSATRTASSAEYIESGIRGHKITALISVIVIAAAVVGISAYLHARNTEVPIKSIEAIAVLPFANQNTDPNTEYLSDGIPESIINSLSHLPNLKVMSRNSVFPYKGKEIDAQEVAKELKVQAVLTGRVTQRGDDLSISVELINAQDNSAIWGQQYNRKIADVFAVQEEIAREISEKLRLKLSGGERQQLAKRPTENIKAFQYYMQGRSSAQRQTRENLLTANHYYEKAIDEDHNYALAYAGLADAYAILGLYGYIPPIEGRRKAEETARKALKLDENLAEAHVALGHAYTCFAPSDFSLGDRELRRAIELSPSLALAHFYLGISLVRQGRLYEALEESLRARELDPLSATIARNAVLPYYFKRDYVRALEQLRQANELGPTLSTTFEIGIYIQNRLFNETLAELEKAKRERKNDPILIYDTGMIHAAQGKRAEALQIINELEEMSGASLSEAHWIAKIYATLNEKEMAFSWLERGLATGAIGVFYKDEPVWDPIRSDPRFRDLLGRMGIPA